MSQLAELILLILGWFLATWGASLILRAAAVKAASLRKFPPFSWLFRGASPFDPRPESIGAWRAGVTVLAGFVAVGFGVFCFRYRAGLGIQDDYDVRDVWAGAVAGLLFAFAAGAFLLGLFADRAGGRPRCPRCWYDMQGLGVQACPECGYAPRREADLLRTRRSKGMFALAVLLLVLAPVPQLFSSFMRGGLLAATPTPVLIAIFERLPPSWIVPSNPNPGPNDATEGPLMVRFARAPAWQQRWLASRLRARLMATSDPIEFAELLGLTSYMSSAGGESVEEWSFSDLRAHALALVSVSLAEYEPSGPVSERFGAVHRAASVGRLFMGRGARFSEGDEQKLLKAIEDPDPRILGEAAVLLAGGGDDLVLKVVPSLVARAGDPAMRPLDRAMLAQALRLIVQFNVSARREVLSVIGDPRSASRAWLFQTIAPGMMPDTDMVATCGGWIGSPDDELAGAALYVMHYWQLAGMIGMDAQAQSNPSAFIVNCDTLAAFLDQRSGGREYIFAAMEYLRCASPAMREHVGAGLRSGNIRVQAAALRVASIVQLDPAPFQSMLPGLLGSPMLDPYAQSLGRTWSGIAPTPTGGPAVGR